MWQQTPGEAGILVGPVRDIPEGSAVRVPVQGPGLPAAIAVFHDSGEFFAIDDTCTHRNASLADGWAEDGEVECPLHGGRFCLRTGAALEPPPLRPVAVFRVEVRDDSVYVFPGAATGGDTGGAAGG